MYCCISDPVAIMQRSQTRLVFPFIPRLYVAAINPTFLKNNLHILSSTLEPGEVIDAFKWN